MDRRIGIIGGSGLGQTLLAEAQGQAVTVDTPFGKPASDIILMQWQGTPVAFLARHGVGHVYNPSQVPYRANIYALKAVGCQWVLASGAVGSLTEAVRPRDLVVVDQVIDKTFRRAGTFFDDAAVHVEFAEPFCPRLRQIIMNAAADLHETRVHPQGTYVCMEGPAFSTRAESRLHRSWGADLIGMTALPEVKLAREAELSFALIALATDYDCWKPHVADAGQSKQALLAEIIENLHAATDNALHLLRAAVGRLWEARDEPFPAHRALELAIWSDKQRISPEARKRLESPLGPLFLGARKREAARFPMEGNHRGGNNL